MSTLFLRAYNAAMRRFLSALLVLLLAIQLAGACWNYDCSRALRTETHACCSGGATVSQPACCSPQALGARAMQSQDRASRVTIRVFEQSVSEHALVRVSAASAQWTDRFRSIGSPLSPVLRI